MPDQPTPKPNGHPAIWDLIRADIDERDRLGEQNYGTRLQPFNGRDFGLDAYEELLDLLAYFKGVRIEVAAMQRELAALRYAVARAMNALEVPCSATKKLQVLEICRRTRTGNYWEGA